MKYILEKDRKKRVWVKRLEKSRSILKSLKQNEFLPLTVRAAAGEKLHFSKGKKSELKNHCVYTSRSRGVLSHFKVSRMVFKELAASGKIQGIKKSSW